MLHPTKYSDDHIVMLLWQHAWFLPLQNEILPFATQQSKYLVLSKTYGSPTFHWVSSLTFFVSFAPCSYKWYYYTSDSLWKIWLVESIQSIHNGLWTWHDKCNVCCRYSIYHVKFNVCLVTKPLGVFSSETKWLNSSLLFLRMNYVKNV